MVLKTSAVPKFKIPDQIENPRLSEADTGDSKDCHEDGDAINSCDSTAFHSNDSTTVDETIGENNSPASGTEQYSDDVSRDTLNRSDSLRLDNGEQEDPLSCENDPLAGEKDPLADVEDSCENMKTLVTNAPNTMIVSPKAQRKSAKLQVCIINLLKNPNVLFSDLISGKS